MNAITIDDLKAFYAKNISPSVAKIHVVGSLDKDGKENFSKSFATADDACAEFILREVSAILNIQND